MIKLSIIRNLLPQVYILFLLSLSPSEATEEKRILIYNAASTSDTINEISKEWEAGFTAGLIDDKLSLEFTYFDRVTEDALYARQFPLWS